MPEPTIDEMLQWLDKTSMDAIMADRIRAILEQHRNIHSQGFVITPANLQARYKLEAIRAFLKRVEKRSNSLQIWEFDRAVYEELAAMERENARTND